ncbi:T9SS type A sorting domain-containing protein, partial [Wandonia haliotis]
EWDYVGELAGAGTTNTESAYVYRDASVQGNGMYYRLIQVDTDGAETLYGPVQSSCEATEDILHVYPNPASDELFVEIAVKESLGSVRIGLYDMSGKRVYAQGTELVKGQTLVQLHNLGVSRGVYLLRIDSEKEHTLKPVKVVIK